MGKVKLADYKKTHFRTLPKNVDYYIVIYSFRQSSEVRVYHHMMIHIFCQQALRPDWMVAQNGGY